MLADELPALVAGLRTVHLATLDAEGVPEASYAPFVPTGAGTLLVYVSELARHTRNMLVTAKAGAMLVEDEASAAELFARRRLSLVCAVSEIPRGTAPWERALDGFEARFGGEVVALVRPITDFRLLDLEARSGRYVRGFAQAYPLDAADLARVLSPQD